jgi:hypothetical protein
VEIRGTRTYHFTAFVVQTGSSDLVYFANISGLDDEYTRALTLPTRSSLHTDHAIVFRPLAEAGCSV